jgi:hypothetical protein
LTSPYTTLGLPPDGVAWGALGAALLLLAPPISVRLARSASALSTRQAVLALGSLAALLSLGYVAYYLRGGPRIIDATSYFLEARAFSRGYFAFPVPWPSGSFRGRFLLPEGDSSLAVIFPPGYPALLALGFLARVPLAIGPLLGGLLVWATYALAKQVSADESTARLAALLSALCAALRYHTADTMSHGLSALLLTVGILQALRSSARAAGASGLAIGWLIATRPVSGMVGLLASGWCLRHKPSALLPFALGLAPGLLLFASYEHAIAGSALSAQLRYYELADGPPGCFRYGFGSQIGCLFEHGEYVRARLAHGYGLAQAASNTLRRLAVHSIDVANAAPLAPLAVYSAWRDSRPHAARFLLATVAALMLAYAPFYFDGSYPGAGARLFAEALPLEHVLLASALVRLRVVRFAIPFALGGFALHGSFEHRALAEREGGRPMFEPGLLERAHVTRGLLFIGTDHGFNLAHLPGARAPNELVVARERDDAHDFLLWQELGRPESHRYRYRVDTGAAVVESFEPTAGRALRVEAENEWPALAVTGSAYPDFRPCASGGGGLLLHPDHGRASVTIGIGVLVGGQYDLRVGWVGEPDSAPILHATLGGTRLEAAASGPTPCRTIPFGPVGLNRGPTSFTVETSDSGFLDYVELTPH